MEKLSKSRFLQVWILACGLAASVLADEVPFATAQTIDASVAGAISLAAGDLDGDGTAEIVGAATGAGEVSFWTNTAGDGSTWTKTLVDGSFTGASAVSVANIDSRFGGSMDILAVSNDLIRVWRNTSNDGSVWTPNDVSTVATFPGPTFAVPAEIDGTGSLDVVGVSATGVSWWFNNFGIGQLWVKNDIEVTGGLASSVAVADLDDDGDTDVIVTFYNGDEVAWYENTAGDGSAWMRRSVATLFDGAQAVTTADLDGDGDLDIAGAALIDDTIAWWENTMGDGSTWIERVVDSTVDDASSVAARDVDGDGDVDLVSAASALGEMLWFDNTTGDGSTWTTRALPGTFLGAAAAIVLDIDDDGDQDVVGAALGAGEVAWWENEAIHRSATFPIENAVATSLGNVRSVHTADVDGDGDDDLLAAVQDAGAVLWWENTSGDGTAWTEHMIDASYAGASGVYAGDLDGDGDLDVYAVSATQNNGVWWANLNGDGSTWGAPFEIFSGSFDPSIPQIVDIDKDGTLDVMAVLTGLFRVTFWRNLDGLGMNWFPSIAQGNYPEARSAHAADIDGDGDADLATVASRDGQVSYVRNGLSLGYQVIEIDNNFPDAFSTFAADLDDDGDRDILAASRSTGEIAWWENTTGNGDFATRKTLATGFVGVTMVRAADLDGDGDFDVYGTSSASNEVVWWENSGDGTSWTRHQVDDALSLAGPVIDADLNGDGKLDLIAAGGDGELDWRANLGGEIALPTTDIAPALVAEGNAVAVLRIDAVHRGRTGDSAVELATVEVLLEKTAEAPMTDMEADDLLASLSLYADDGSGSFEPESDTEIASLQSFVLDAGVATLEVADDQVAAQIAATDTRVYFIVPAFEATASSTVIDGFRFSHITEASSTGEDAVNDLPLTLEYAANVATVPLGFNAAPVAQDDGLMLFEDQNATSNVLDGSAGGLDTDANGTTLTAILVDPPTQGSLVAGLDADGGFEYMPPPDFNGFDTFTYRADDGVAVSNLATVTLTVAPVNDPPSFDITAQHISSEDAAPQTVSGFAFAISPGPANEAGQVTTFEITGNTNASLFATLPGIATDGTLTYETAADAVGTATLTVRLRDDGGTSNGGVDHSADQSFDVVVEAVNDAPTFAITSSTSSLEDAGAQSVASFATAISAGPDNEAGQVLDFVVTDNTDPELFSTPPALSTDGTLTYTAATDANGTATITVVLMDDGGTANGGVDQSIEQSFDIDVTAVNDPPSFEIPASLEVESISTPQTVVDFATEISPGPENEAGQVLQFQIVSNSAPELFAVGPALAADGTLTFTLAAGVMDGSALLTVTLMDDGGTDSGGVDTSAPSDVELIVLDVIAPQVVSITAPTGDIDVCTEVRQGFDGLDVLFSEPMAFADTPDEPGSVVNPDNYQLIASGPDQDVTTLACDALDGDDLRIFTSAIVPEPTTDGVRVELPRVLDDGLYRLLVCDALQDAAGNELVDTFDVAFRVDEANRFINGQTDCDLAGWSLVAEVANDGSEFAYSTNDADDSSLSGSIGITTLGSTRFAIGQCFDVVGPSIELAARVRIDGMPDVEVTANLRCELFAQPACTGPVVGESSNQVLLTPTAGAWQLIEHVATADVSALCGVDLELTSGSGFEAFVDRLWASTALFADGFESGTTSAWSVTVP
ncbi:MAG: FG-GAP-like repeat-containing protein [Acidobacteriota bacterium]